MLHTLELHTDIDNLKNDLQILQQFLLFAGYEILDATISGKLKKRTVYIKYK